MREREPERQPRYEVPVGGTETVTEEERRELPRPTRRRATAAPAGRFRWGAALWAGILAGAVFMVLEMVLVPIFLGGSFWGPPRLIAAMGMGPEVLPPPATFDAGVITAGFLIHLALSVLFAIVLAAIVHRMSMGVGVLVGAVYGLALYLVNFYLWTGVFPWFAEARNWVTVTTHIAFGVIAAAVYLGALHRRRREVVA